MKNYLGGFSMEQRLVNTVVGYGLESLGFNSQFTVLRALPPYYSKSSVGSSPQMQTCQGRKLTTPFHLLFSGPVSLANFTAYLHNKGRDSLVILNTSFGLLTKSKKSAWFDPTKKFV